MDYKKHAEIAHEINPDVKIWIEFLKEKEGGMTKERKMAVVTVLKKIIRLYKETTFIPPTSEFFKRKIKDPVLRFYRRIVAYYQHIEFDKDLFFANQNFNIVLLPFDSPARTVECWALQDILQFSEGQYQIFATTVQMIFFSVI